MNNKADENKWLKEMTERYHDECLAGFDHLNR